MNGKDNIIMTKAITCAFSGHRPKLLPWGYDETTEECLALKEQIKNRIIEAIFIKAYRHFISGMAIGCDIFFAEIILELKKDYPFITLECAIPYTAQYCHWTNKDKYRYLKILENCDQKTILAEHFTKDAFMNRNKYMIDKSSLLIAVYNGVGKSGTRNTIGYAKKSAIDVIIIDI